MPRELTRPMPRRADERGATLLLMALLVFLLLTGFTVLASTQLLHAERVNAEYGRLQALNAAEAGIYASLATRTPHGPTNLSLEGAPVTFETRLTPSAPGLGPYWIASTGSLSVGGEMVHARVGAFVSNGSIQEWTFE